MVTAKKSVTEPQGVVNLLSPDIIVVGSLNMDLVVVAPRLPSLGETVYGDSFSMFPGGKGANQALAASKLGSTVAMVGRIGDDAFGRQLLASLSGAGVNTSSIIVEHEAPTGTALIEVDSTGENRIIVVAGANAHLSPDDIDATAASWGEARILMLQQEIPQETVLYAARKAKEKGLTVILDPAPARPLAPELAQLVDIITPNEHEAEILLGQPVGEPKEALAAVSRLRQLGFPVAIIKLGANGAVVAWDQGCKWVKGYAVTAIDTTAAGDAFAGGLATALARGQDVLEALSFANATGALSTTRPGAQTSMPTRKEVEAFFEQHGGIPHAASRTTR